MVSVLVIDVSFRFKLHIMFRGGGLAFPNLLSIVTGIHISVDEEEARRLRAKHRIFYPRVGAHLERLRQYFP